MRIPETRLCGWLRGRETGEISGCMALTSSGIACIGLTLASYCSSISPVFRAAKYFSVLILRMPVTDYTYFGLASAGVRRLRVRSAKHDSDNPRAQRAAVLASSLLLLLLPLLIFFARLSSLTTRFFTHYCLLLLLLRRAELSFFASPDLRSPPCLSARCTPASTSQTSIYGSFSLRTRTDSIPTTRVCLVSQSPLNPY